MRRKQLIRLLPILPLALIVGAATWASEPPTAEPSKNQAVKTTPSVMPTPEPTPSPQVMVNGQPVPVDANGNASIALPKGKATVSTSAGQTTVTTDSTTGTATTVSGDGNLNVSVQSQSTGGNSWESTQVHGFGHGSTMNSTFSTTTVFSNGESNVQVHP